MRYLFFFILLLVLAVASVVVSQLYLSEPLLVQYGNRVVQPPLWLAFAAFILGGIVLLLALRLLLWVFFFPARLSAWRHNRRNEKQLQLHENILRQSVYNNPRNLLKELAKIAAQEPAAAWRAAQVAEDLGDAHSQARHLQHAAAGKDVLIAAVAKAKLCLQDDRLTEAHTLLKSVGAPGGSGLLAQLYYEVAQRRGQAEDALAAAMHLRDESPALYGKWVEDTIVRRFNQVADAAAANAFWRESVSSADKKNPALLVHYLRALWRLGDEKAAADGLGQALRNHPKSNEVLQAVVDFGSTEQRETAFKANEKRADKASEHDVHLLEILTALAEKLNLPGKARLYGQMLSSLQAPQGEQS